MGVPLDQAWRVCEALDRIDADCGAREVAIAVALSLDVIGSDGRLVSLEFRPELVPPWR